jgi:hypothetical protein
LPSPTLCSPRGTALRPEAAAPQTRQDPEPGRLPRRAARISPGNFRLIDRFFTQVERLIKINELNTITDDVTDAACSTFVIGTSQKRPNRAVKTAISNQQSHR